MHKVYKSDDHWFFSDGVTRDFGQNKLITKLNGETFFTAVMPLKCNPAECGLELFGSIKADTERAAA